MNCDKTKDLLDSFLKSGKSLVNHADFASNLHALRIDLGENHWESTMIPTCRAHALFDYFLQDPYTFRAFSKPRGYAGDAVMLDYIYNPPPELSENARVIFDFTTNSMPAKAVVWRRDYFAQTISKILHEKGAARILAFACGHFREASSPNLDCTHPNLCIVAVDQDSESISIVERDYKHPSIQCKELSLKNLLKGGDSDIGKFDLLYAAGLYDYLNHEVASLLTRKLFSLTERDGKVVVSNFLSKHSGRSYMEAFMDWNLILRSEEEIRHLARAIPTGLVKNSKYLEDPYSCIGYLEIERGDV